MWFFTDRWIWHWDHDATDFQANCCQCDTAAQSTQLTYSNMVCDNFAIYWVDCNHLWRELGVWLSLCWQVKNHCWEITFNFNLTLMLPEISVTHSGDFRQPFILTAGVPCIQQPFLFNLLERVMMLIAVPVVMNWFFMMAIGVLSYKMLISKVPNILFPVPSQWCPTQQGTL